jgi:cation transport ATPase
MQQLLWLATLPLFGAASAFLSRRAGGDRLTGLTAALFPSMVMIPLWIALATRMNHPSSRQFSNLFGGVLNWIVLPGVALSLGALPFLKARHARDSKESESTRTNAPTMNTRSKTFWLPSLVSLTAAMVCLMISTEVAKQPRFEVRGLATLATYIPWLLMLPLCGAAGAYLSRRAGGERLVRLGAGLFPVIALTTLVAFLTLIGKFVYAKPQWFYFSIAVLCGAILPSAALLLGAVPFVKDPKSQKS